MKICIMHFASSLLRFFWAKFCFLEFLYGILVVLFRCCFHHLVENSILYKKDIQKFYIGPIPFQKIKSYGRWSVESFTVKFYLVPGVRSRKFYLAPGMRNRKIYLAPKDNYEKFYLAVKGLTNWLYFWHLFWLWSRFSKKNKMTYLHIEALHW